MVIFHLVILIFQGAPAKVVGEANYQPLSENKGPRSMSRQMSNEKKGAPASLGYIGDEILPSYTEIIIKFINHYKDPY